MPRSRKNDEFDELIKELSQQRGWNVVGGQFLYRVSGEFIYELAVRPPYEGILHGELSVKPLAVDPVFWEIVGSPELCSRRAGFRLNGAFTLRMAHLANCDREIDLDDWTRTATAVVDALQEAFETSTRRLITLADFGAVLDEEVPRHPRLSTTQVAWLIASEDFDGAQRVLRDGIESDPNGGFIFQDGGFNEIALDYLVDRAGGSSPETSDPAERRWAASTNNQTPSRLRARPAWSIQQNIERRLRELNGHDKYALSLWQLPPRRQLHQLDLSTFPQEYMQCAGSFDGLLTCEIRVQHNNSFIQYVIGRAAADDTGITQIPWNGHTATVRSHEVLAGEHVLILFHEYFRTAELAEGYTRRAIDV